MPDGQLNLTDQRLKTTRAAALAGILFAAPFSSSILLMRLSIPVVTSFVGSERYIGEI